MKKKGLAEKPHLKKQKRVSSGFTRITSRPAGSPGFGRVFALAGLFLYPDRSSHQVPGRPARPV